MLVGYVWVCVIHSVRVCVCVGVWGDDKGTRVEARGELVEVVLQVIRAVEDIPNYLS